MRHPSQGASGHHRLSQDFQPVAALGFGLELALEAEPTELPLDSLEQSWPYLLLERVAPAGVTGDGKLSPWPVGRHA